MCNNESFLNKFNLILYIIDMHKNKLISVPQNPGAAYCQFMDLLFPGQYNHYYCMIIISYTTNIIITSMCVALVCIIAMCIEAVGQVFLDI